MGSYALIDSMMETQRSTPSAPLVRTPARSHSVDEVVRKRSEAQALLQSLISSKREADHGPSDNRRDLFKRVTGHSSLENAILATRRAIDAFDRMLNDSNPMPRRVGNMPTIKVTANGVPSVL